MTRTVLVTGGAGYIGSHVVVALLDQGDDVVVVDSLVNSSARSLEVVAELTGRTPVLVTADIRDGEALSDAFAAHDIDAVVHCAGLKAVGESVAEPLGYWDANVTGTIRLLEAMDVHDVRRIVFSSSATVYHPDAPLPFGEDAPTGPTNPYGSTKLVIERLLADVAGTDERWRVVSLRYFNPVGAHPSGRLGEDPRGIPNNLMPRLLKVATGEWPSITVFGTDYPTRDGTGVRDYLHVSDLADGHLAALDAMDDLPPVFTCNLGRGDGVSVTELIDGVERASGRAIERTVEPRRPGDIAESYAAVDRAADRLGWRARLGADDMCADAWRWASNHPTGFDT